MFLHNLSLLMFICKLFLIICAKVFEFIMTPACKIVSIYHYAEYHMCIALIIVCCGPFELCVMHTVFQELVEYGYHQRDSLVPVCSPRFKPCWTGLISGLVSI